MPQTVRVVRAVEEVAIGADGKVVQQVRVEFTVGEHGPFTMRFAREGFRGPEALLKMEEFAREIEGMVR